jgi:hypothetical protein
MFDNFINAIDIAKNSDDQLLYRRAIHIGLDLLKNKQLMKVGKQYE